MGSPTGEDSNPFEWQGDLAAAGGGEAILEQCSRLKLSGLIEAEAPGDRTRLALVAGEVPEIGGGDPQTISKRTHGRFRVIQRIPDLRGVLTDVERIAGLIAEHPPVELLRFCEEYRLTADLDLSRDGDEVSVEFAAGRMVGVTAQGRPDLGALARAKAWGDGRFRITLRPLFGEPSAAAPEALVSEILVGPTEVTGAVTLPVPGRPTVPAPPPGPETLPGTVDEPARRFDRHTSAPVMPSPRVELAPVDGIVSAPDARDASGGGTRLPRGAEAAEDDEPFAGGGRRTTLWALATLGGLVLAGGGAGLAWRLLRSPPPSVRPTQVAARPADAGPGLVAPPADAGAGGLAPDDGGAVAAADAGEPDGGALDDAGAEIEAGGPSVPAGGRRARAHKLLDAAYDAFLDGDLRHARRALDGARRLGAGAAAELTALAPLVDDDRGVGALNVETRPIGAKVMLEGVPLGPAPVKLRALAVGRYTLGAEADGARQGRQQITIKKGRTTRVKLRLRRSPKGR